MKKTPSRHIRLRRLGATFVFALSIIVSPFSSVEIASAATLTWDGSAGDGKFSTGANWNTNSAPVNGDIITLPVLAGGPQVSLANDVPGLVLAGITLGADVADYDNATYYTIDTLHFSDGATITQKKSAALSVSGDITADGALVFDGTSSPFGASSHDITVDFTDLTVQNAPAACMGGGAPEYRIKWAPSGTVNITGVGTAYSLQPGSTASAVIVGSGSILSVGYYASTTTYTYAGDITFNGGSATACGSAAAPLYIANNVTLSGTVTLSTNDIQFEIADGKTLTVTGPIEGAEYKLSAFSGSTGTFVNSSSSNNSLTPGGIQEVPVTVLPDVNDKQPNATFEVASKTTVALNGTRGSVYVYSSGTIKGTGTMAYLYVSAGGVVAPGKSPGKLTVLNLFSLSGTYTAEVLDENNYDQIEAESTQLDTAATLNLVLFEGYSITKGDQFMIVENTGSSPVSGTFANLPEGEQFKVGNITFSITYTGGAGNNDIILTALNTGSDPNAPNTGVNVSQLANPIAVVALGVLAAAFFLGLAIKRRTSRG